MTSPAEQLRALGPAALQALLERRPDVLVGPSPRTLAELAQRLDHPSSVMAAITRVTLPVAQVAGVVAALGQYATRPRLTELLGADPGAQVQELAELSLVHPQADGTLIASPGIRSVLADPMGLGRPFRQLADVVTATILFGVQKTLGRSKSAAKWSAVDDLAAFYADADAVRARAGAMRAPVQQALQEYVWPPGNDRADDDGYDPEFDDNGYEADYRFAVQRYDQRHEQTRDALESGLVIPTGYGGQNAEMPAEVALALRGADYRVTFNPEPPVVARRPVARVEADAAAASSRLDELSVALFDQLSRAPLAVLKSGGVGARELTRLGKTLQATPAEVRLVLELVFAAGLLDVAGQVTGSVAGAAWREDDPADRFVRLAQTWWEYAGIASEPLDADGAVRRALWSDTCVACRVGRQAWLRLLPDGEAVDPLEAEQLVVWNHPTAHVSSLTWDEGAALGVCAQNARTSLGAALVAGDVALLRTAVGAALPATNDRAVFGTDLTAFVAGSPSARVSALLDSVADRESRGGAVTWRFRPGSVRRALDEGALPRDLLESLRTVAGGELPQTLTVLLDDVARQHGRVRVSDVVAVMVSDDVALLAHILRDRKLAKLGLTQVAPTVLVGGSGGAATVTALRAAGYLPVLDSASSTVQIAASSRPAPGGPSAVRSAVRSPPRSAGRLVPPEPRRADPAALARTLLTERVVQRTSTEKQLASLSRSLSDAEIHLLADAIDSRDEVQIVYRASTGGLTDRVVRPELLAGGSLWAHCFLRKDQRVFTVQRIESVSAV